MAFAGEAPRTSQSITGADLSGGYQLTPGPSDPEAVKAVQSAGASGHKKYWIQNPNGMWWYDFAAEQADITKAGLSEQYGTGKTTTRLSTTTAITAPSITTKTWKPPGERPEIGEFTAFQMPDRPGTPSFQLPEMGTMPEFAAPEMKALPEFAAPERDEARQRILEQRAAAPGIRSLREAQSAIRAAARRDDPQARLTLKEALGVYGTNLEKVMSGASRTAQSQYNEEYRVAYDAATKNWGAKVQQTRDEYGYEYGAAEKNWKAAVQSVRDKYAGQIEARKYEYQAELDAVNQIFAAEVGAEKQRVASENARVVTIFDAAMDEYFKAGVETVSTTGGERTTATTTTITEPGQKPYWEY